MSTSATTLMKNQRAPTKDELDASFPSVASQRPAAMSVQGSDGFETRTSTPPYLKRSLPNCPHRKLSTSSSIAFTGGNRPDITDVVARRMVGRALGIEMPKKEDTRNFAIDFALKQNAKRGNTSRKEVKQTLEKDEGVKDGMATVEEGVSHMAITEKRESLNERAEKQHIKDWGAYLGAWKAGQSSKAKDNVEEEKPNSTVADEDVREKEIAASKAAEAKKRMDEFYALMKSRGKK
jgi:hypothetical protein